MKFVKMKVVNKFLNQQIISGYIAQKNAKMHRLQESLEKENVKMLLRETKGMNDKDIATAISLIKVYKDSK